MGNVSRMGSVGSFLSRAGIAAVALSLLGAGVAVADTTKVDASGPYAIATCQDKN